MKAREFVLAATSVFFVFLVLEGLWRVYLFNAASDEHQVKWMRPTDMAENRLKFSPHPYTSYANSRAYRAPDGPNRNNDLGFRGDDFPLEKPAGEYRIACVGGSSTYDTEIDEPGLAYPAQLERALREDHGYENVRVINAGVGGYSSWETLIHLQLRVLETQPDLVVVYHAVNDVHARIVPPEIYRRDNSAHRRAWREEPKWWDMSLFLHYVGVQLGFSQRNSLSAFTRVPYEEGDVDAEAALEANSPKYFRENLENIVALSRYHGADVLLTSWAYSTHHGDYVTQPAYRRGIAEHNKVSRAVAAKTGTLFYDFAAQMSPDPRLWDDGRHNTPEGARKKAELFAAFIHTTYLSPSTPAIPLAD